MGWKNIDMALDNQWDKKERISKDWRRIIMTKREEGLVWMDER